jgi:hypothetical protein
MTYLSCYDRNQYYTDLSEGQITVCEVNFQELSELFFANLGMHFVFLMFFRMSLTSDLIPSIMICTFAFVLYQVCSAETFVCSSSGLGLSPPNWSLN